MRRSKRGCKLRRFYTQTWNGTSCWNSESSRESLQSANKRQVVWWVWRTLTDRISQQTLWRYGVWDLFLVQGEVSIKDSQFSQGWQSSGNTSFDEVIKCMFWMGFKTYLINLLLHMLPQSRRRWLGTSLEKLMKTANWSMSDLWFIKDITLRKNIP